MNTKQLFLTCAASTIGIVGSAHADTYGLLQEGVSGTVPLETDADGTTKENGLYLRIGAGVNFAMDADGKDLSDSIGNQTNQTISFDTGFEFNIALGIPLTEQWSLEVMTGVAMNGVDSFSGKVDIPALGFFGTFTYDDGDLYQVPLVANIRYDFELNEKIGLGVYAGAGLQYSYIETSGGKGIAPGFPPIDIGSESGNAWAFRYQLGVDLSWDVAANMTLGLNVRYSGTSESDFGPGLKLDSLSNATIGATFSYTF
jgi:opacity protein-like surface antigen